MKNEIICGDALEELKKLPDESVDCVMTSPPYWALRDYGVKGQLGLEPTFQEYITKLCDIFDQVKRVLKKTGTCWVNMGDTYSGSWGDSGHRPERTGIEGHQRDKNTGWFERKGHPKQNPPCRKTSVQNKCLLQIPSRFGLEMTNRGWILRNEIIWFKPNCMPSSVKDRFTVDFEKIFFFVKSKKYYFETQYEPTIEEYSPERAKRPETSRMKAIHSSGKPAGNFTYNKIQPQGRNKRAVWRITTKPYKEAHFATYPEELCETPIKAGCPKDGVILDPFFGAGTTGVVAKKLGRSFVGIELNPAYIKIAKKRLSQQLLNL